MRRVEVEWTETARFKKVFEVEDDELDLGSDDAIVDLIVAAPDDNENAYEGIDERLIETVIEQDAGAADIAAIAAFQSILSAVPEGDNQ